MKSLRRFFYMRRPVQGKCAAKAAHGSRASRGEKSSLLDFTDLVRAI